MAIRLNIKGSKLEFDDVTNNLYEDGTLLDRDARTVGEMKEVLLDKSFATEKNYNKQTYLMFRGAGTKKKKAIFESYSVRHDVTVMLDFDLGKEYNKTLGHYHPMAASGISYPELYEVLQGKAMFVLQKRLPEEKYDVKLVKAFAGDKVFVPPDYGHVTVNIGKGLLILANLVNSDFASDYEPFRRMRGAAVFYTSGKEVILNQNYKEMAITVNGKKEKINYLDETKSIYDNFVKNPHGFGFLSKPELL